MKVKEGGEVSLTPPPGLAGVMSPASGVADVSAESGQHHTAVPSDATAPSQQAGVQGMQIVDDVVDQHPMLGPKSDVRSLLEAPRLPLAFPGAGLPLKIGGVTVNLPPSLEDKSVVQSGNFITLKGMDVLKNTVTALVLVHEGADGAPFVHPAPRGARLSATAFAAYLGAKNRVGTQLRANLNKTVQECGVPPNSFHVVNVDIDVSRAGTAFATVFFVCRDAHVGYKMLKCAFNSLPPIKGTTFEVLPEGSSEPEEVVKTSYLIDKAVSGVNASGGCAYSLIEVLFNTEAIMPESTFSFDAKNTERAVMTVVHKPTADPLAAAVPRTGPSRIRVGSVWVSIRNSKFWAPCACGSHVHHKSDCPLKHVAVPPVAAAPAAPKLPEMPRPRLHAQPLAPAQVVLEGMKMKSSPPPPPSALAPKPASALAASSPLPQRAVNSHSAPSYVMPPMPAHLPPSQTPVVTHASVLEQYLAGARSIPPQRGGRGGNASAPSHRAASLTRLLVTATQMPQCAELRAAAFAPAFLLSGQSEMRAFLSDAIRGIADPDLKLYNLTEEFIKIVMCTRDVEYIPPTCPEGFTMVDSNKKGSKKRVASDSSTSDDAAAGEGAVTGAVASTTSSPPAKRAARKAGGAAADSDTQDDDMSDRAGPPLNGHYDDQNAD